MQPIVVIAWTISLSTLFVVIYGLNMPVLFETGLPPSEATNIFYGGLHRLAWAIALAWVIWACAKGYGGETIS